MIGGDGGGKDGNRVVVGGGDSGSDRGIVVATVV